jgi:hypothetical protein
VNATTVTILRCLPGYRMGKRYWRDGAGQLQSDAADGIKCKNFEARKLPISDLAALGKLLRRLETDERAFIIHGAVRPPALTTGRRVNRKTARLNGRKGDILCRSVRWVCIDIDETVEVPNSIDPFIEPEKAFRWIVNEALPAEFHEADFIGQWSSSAGIKGDIRLARCHLWFELLQPVHTLDLRRWAQWWNAQNGGLIDEALYLESQPIYTTAPVCGAGVVDPFAGNRTQFVSGQHQAVDLQVPTSREAERMHNATRRRAASAARQAGAPAEVIKAVKDGTGPAAFWALIGFNGQVRAQIRGGIGAALSVYGPDIDPAWVEGEIRRYVKASPFLLEQAPRGSGKKDRAHALAYLTPTNPSGLSNVAEMIRDLAERESHKPVAASVWPEQGMPLAEAEGVLRDGLASAFAKHAEARHG